MFIYLLASYGNVNLLATDGIKSEIIGTVKNETIASRICVLLNREGMQDCTVETLADALTDLEQREQ